MRFDRLPRKQDASETTSQDQEPHMTEFGGSYYDVAILEQAAKEGGQRVDYDLTADNVDAIIYGKYWKVSDGEMIGPSDLLSAYESVGQDWARVAEERPDWILHIRKVVRADRHQDFPLLVHAGTLIDGVHRLTRAIADGAVSIPAYVLYELPSEALSQ